MGRHIETPEAETQIFFIKNNDYQEEYLENMRLSENKAPRQPRKRKVGT